MPNNHAKTLRNQHSKKRDAQWQEARRRRRLTTEEKFAETHQLLCEVREIPCVIAGSGLTTDERIPFPGELTDPDPNTERKLERFWKEIRPASACDQFHTSIDEAISWAKQRLHQLQCEEVSERETESWYCREILSRAELVPDLKPVFLQKEELSGADIINFLEIADLERADVIGAAFQIGALYTEARFKFTHERDAISGKKARDGSRMGQEQRSKVNIGRNQNIIAAVDSHLNAMKKPNVSQAAKLVAKSGQFGASAANIRSIWYRRQEKKKQK